MKKLVEHNYDKEGKNFIYMVLDDYAMRKMVKEIGLKYVLSRVKKRLTEPLVIIIDEASAVEDWDVHVKNVIDSFVREGVKFLLIVTGSLGLRLIKGSTNILGRRGDIPALRNIANPGVILPYKFSEYAEALQRVREFIRFYDLLTREERGRILLKLAEPEAIDTSFWKIEKAYDEFNELLARLFRIYLVVTR